MSDDRKPCVLCKFKTNKLMNIHNIPLCDPCQGKLGNTISQKEYLLNSPKVSKEIKSYLFEELSEVESECEEDSTDIEGHMKFGNKASAITFIVGLMDSMDISSEEIEENML